MWNEFVRSFGGISKYSLQKHITGGSGDISANLKPNTILLSPANNKTTTTNRYIVVGSIYTSKSPWAACGMVKPDLRQVVFTTILPIRLSANFCRRSDLSTI